MPLYEYQCSKCGNVFEVIQKYSDAPLKKHQGCGGKVEKLISASAFQLKGSGWYATDYAKAGAKSEDKSEGKSEAKTDGKSDGKSESKTETKTESKSEPKADAKSEPKKDSKPAPASKKSD
jgi:putative FmdB family regulatory protein